MMEIIQITDRTTSRAVVTNAVRVCEYLCVVQTSATGFRIYKTKQGTLFDEITFTSLEDATKFAKWIDKKFGEYFPIWDKWPKADVIGMAKWSVSDGIAVFELLNIVRGRKNVKLSTLAHVLKHQEIKSRVHHWTRNIRRSC